MKFTLHTDLQRTVNMFMVSGSTEEVIELQQWIDEHYPTAFHPIPVMRIDALAIQAFQYAEGGSDAMAHMRMKFVDHDWH